MHKSITEMSDHKKERIMYQIEEFEMGTISPYILIKRIKQILNED